MYTAQKTLHGRVTMQRGKLHCKGTVTLPIINVHCAMKLYTAGESYPAKGQSHCANKSSTMQGKLGISECMMHNEGSTPLPASPKVAQTEVIYCAIFIAERINTWDTATWV